jgi:hypothetical protein
METLTGRRAQRANSRRNRPTLRDEIGFVLQFVSWVVYFSPRLLCRFDLLGRASSIRRRIASDREGLSFCCLAQVSIADRVPGGSRTVRTGSSSPLTGATSSAAQRLGLSWVMMKPPSSASGGKSGAKLGRRTYPATS